jgi:hypothetical protein
VKPDLHSPFEATTNAKTLLGKAIACLRRLKTGLEMRPDPRK